ncbi:MAG: CoA transferase [Acidimicrobiaceae bacterium]|nr:CoA transferase [Acidimicrobiaceae bacterium]
MPDATPKRTRKSFEPTLQGPLHGVRVVDISRLVSGNVLSTLLGDFGADVIKVEPPSGDPLRAWTDEGVSFYWKTYGRNKRSLVLDLRQKTAIDALLKLIKKSQVLVENFKPGTLEKMGLAPEVLLEVNPDLIIARISGFGQDGPYATMPGFGSLIEAMSGLASRTGFADREPLLPPFPVADMVAGVFGALSTLIALRANEQGISHGQVVDISLLEPLFSLLGPEAGIFQLTGKVKPRVGSGSNTTAPRNVYRCSDGKYVALSGSIQSMAERIFEVIGRSDLVTDPRFRTNADRIANRGELDKILGSWFEGKKRDDVLELIRAAGATIGPVYAIDDALSDPHFIEREILIDVDDDDLGTLVTQNIVPRLTETPGGLRLAAPRIGQHSVEILELAGLGHDEIETLIRSGSSFQDVR